MPIEPPVPLPPARRVRTRPAEAWLWDVFCRVIDNHGDLGVLWRLSVQLADRGHRVRLWVDDASALAWMAPMGHARVQVCDWSAGSKGQPHENLPPAHVWVEGFGCEINPEFIAAYLESVSDGAADKSNFPVWLNLEYLTAESFAERCHLLPSPVMAGPGQGATKVFFYPGFSPRTGGLLRETDLFERQSRFDRRTWLQAHGIDWQGEKLVSLFCYEPRNLGGLLRTWATGSETIRLLVAHGRPAVATRAALQNLLDTHQSEDGGHSDGSPPQAGAGSAAKAAAGSVQTMGQLVVHFLPALSQIDYDHLLWACDWNFVRGEDSLVRAIWAGKPLVWHIYPQADGVHHQKLDAFLDRLAAPISTREWHQWWNQDDHAPQSSAQPTDRLQPWPDETERNWAALVRHQLTTEPDLVSQLEACVQHHRPHAASRPP